MVSDLELATTDQLMNEFVKRDIPFIFLLPPHKGVINGDSAQVHCFGLGPQQTVAILHDVHELVSNVVEGNPLPKGVRFLVREMDQDGNCVKETRLGPNFKVLREEEDDPWSSDDN